MNLTEAVEKPMFGRHETFHPRYGWLKKAYDLVKDDPYAFRNEDATVRFGVGKNMVSAIRFWSLAFKVLETKDNGLESTDVGKMIFSENGFDPYLEREETLWLLHWKLLLKPCVVPTWWIIMNEIAPVMIRTDEIHGTVTEHIRNHTRWKHSSHSIKRDVSVFLHTYTSKQDRLTPEEYLDCPFRNMHLAKTDKDSLRFVFGQKTGLTPEMVAFACADFAARSGTTGRTLSVTRLATEHGSVGNTFRLSEGDLVLLLKKACAHSNTMRLSNVSGISQVVFTSTPAEAADEMLRAIYRVEIVMTR